MECHYCEEIKDDSSLVLETSLWKIFLSNDQAYLGRCRIFTKEHIGSLGELSTAHWEEFGGITAMLENALKKTFDAKMFNWTSMMNDAYKSENPNPHVHIHFRPRYEKSIQLEDTTFEDPEFGKHYDRARRMRVEEKVQKIIINKIKEKLAR